MAQSSDQRPEIVSPWRKYALICSVILFLVACVTPALVLHVKEQLGAAGSRWQGYESISGAALLAIGLALGWIRFNFTAFANFPLWISWILFARRRYSGSRFFSLLALAMSIETLQLIVQPYLGNEGGTTEGYLAFPHVGFYCWIGSMLVIAFASHRLRSEAR
jgi:hypothetical protein